MGQALGIFKRSKSTDKKAAADRVHEWMLDQLALTEFSTSDQLTPLVFVESLATHFDIPYENALKATWA